MNPNERRLIKQRALFNGQVTRTEVVTLCDYIAELEQQTRRMEKH